MSVVLSIQAAAALVSGKLLRPVTEPAPARFVGASTDSRTLSPGQAFFAITGERFDGHDFLAQAVARGAALLVISRDLDESLLAELPPSVGLLRVADTRLALGALARAWRRRLNPAVIAITGSVGKTTTKELTRAVLAHAGRTHATSGNLNNNIGLPLTILAMPEGTRYLVLEMGMNAPGEIAYLTGLAEPRVGCITAVAPVHLEGLGTLEAVAAAKAELLAGLGDSAFAVVPSDAPLLDPYLRRLRPEQVMHFGTKPDDEARLLERRPIGRTEPGEVIGTAGEERGGRVRSVRNRRATKPAVSRTSLATGGQPVGAVGVHGQRARGSRLQLSLRGGHPFTFDLPLCGTHNAINAVAAAGIGALFGVSEAQIVAGLSAAPDLGHRSALRELGPWHVLDDCYNANPVAVRAALDTLRELADGEPAVAVLGAMLELGSESERYHLEVGEHAAASGLRLLVTVGPQAAAIAEGARRAGHPADRMVEVNAPAEAASVLASRVPAGSWILIKASRGARLEGVLEGLRESREP